MLNFNKKRFLKEKILEIKGMQLKIKKLCCTSQVIKNRNTFNTQC